MKNTKITIKLFPLFLLFSLVFTSCQKEVGYNLFDIVLSDGSSVSAESYKKGAGEAVPIAVIFSVSALDKGENKNRVLGVGLYKADRVLEFTNSRAKGCNINFLLNQTQLINQRVDLATGYYTNDGFIGFIDGRLGFSHIKSFDGRASKNTARDYPAYNFVNSYGKVHQYKEFERGWYLGTAYELYELSLNIDKVNKVIRLCGGDEINNLQWSSSQVANATEQQYMVNVNTREVQDTFKNESTNVRAIYFFGTRGK